jgi:hypothetical protein
MGHRARVRQTGKTSPSLDAHARHNSSHDGYTWHQHRAERAALEAERGVRFERVNEDEDDEELEAA